MSAPSFGWLFYTLTYVSLLTLLPDTVAEEDRAFVTGAMPLAGIASSMTLGIIMLRRYTPVQVTLTGFVLATIIVLLLGLDPDNTFLCIALFGALGLVQGASFAAVPNLNATPQTQAYANGAMAQMGNLGNTVGTPLLLVILVSFGLGGAIVMLILCYLLGIMAHLLLQWRRTRMAA